MAMIKAFEQMSSAALAGDRMFSIGGKSSKRAQTGVTLTYVGFAAVALSVYHLVAQGEFSSILTISAIFQCLAFVLLAIQMVSSEGVRCISAKSLQLDAIAFACRLSSTTWLNGYLPVDVTGDYLYQVFDFASLLMVLWLLSRVQKIQSNADDENISVVGFASVALILAGLLHGNLNNRPIFDTLWMCSLFIGTVAVVPQLWVMTRSHVSVPALTCHFVSVMAFSRLLSAAYMWHAHNEITCEPWIGKFNHAGFAILAAHLLHLVLLGDFAFYYVKNLATCGLSAPLDFVEALNMV
jgi:hypothetical protein